MSARTISPPGNRHEQAFVYPLHAPLSARRCAGVGRRHQGCRRRSDDRRPGHVRPADEGRRRAGRGRHQRRRRCAGKKAQARDRRRCLRSQTGALDRGEAIRHGRCGRRRALLFLVLDPGLGRLSQLRHSANHAGIDQSAVHRTRHVEHVPDLRTRRPAGWLCRRLSGEALQGQEHRYHQRQDHVRQRPRRRGEEGAQRRRRQREAERIVQPGRQGLHRARFQAQAQQHRYRL